MAGKKLTAKAVEGNLKAGYHSDGTVPGLYLAVGKSGSKSWVFRYVPPKQAGTVATRAAGATAGRNKPRAMGLGPFPAINLALARDRAREERTKLALGIDPLEERRKEETAVTTRITTFAEAASAYIEAKVELEEGGFKNPKHRQQWRNTLETYANPIIGGINVAHIDTDLVLKVLQQETEAKGKSGPLWNMKTETASRLRGRIENVLSWAAFRGLRAQGDNPARWKGHLDNELTARNKLQKPEHRPALPYVEVGALMEELRKRDTVIARALQFAILTASRPGNVPAATWDEIDLKEKSWSISGAKMKAGKDHQVPLTDEMIAILNALPREENNPHVFIGTSKGGCISENALNNTAKAVSGKDITAHGFRSSFRDWAGETTAHPREVIEHGLSHQLKDRAEAAYARGTLMAKRRKLMADWSKYCSTVRSEDANVVSIHAGAS